MSELNINNAQLSEFAHHGLVKRRFLTGVAVTKRFAFVHKEIVNTIHALVNAALVEGRFYADQFQRDMERQFPEKFLVYEMRGDGLNRKFRLVFLRPPDWHYMDVSWRRNAFAAEMDMKRASWCADLKTLYDKIYERLLHAAEQARDPFSQDLEKLRSLRQKSSQYYFHPVSPAVPRYDILGAVPDQRRSDTDEDGGDSR